MIFSSSSLFLRRSHCRLMRFPSSSLSLSLLTTSFRSYAEQQQMPNTSSSSSSKISSPPPEADFATSCPFKCLGLTRSATKEEVRQNFLQLAKIHHPDVGGETKKFRRVQAAYKQSIEMIETGYAAKTVQKSKEANYRAPNERDRNNRGRTGDDDADEEDEQHARRSSYYYSSTRKSTASESKSGSDARANEAEEEARRNASAFNSGTRRAADREAAGGSGGSTRNSSSSSSQGEQQSSTRKADDNDYTGKKSKQSSRFSQQKQQDGSHSSTSASHFYSAKDKNAKAYNNRRDWFRETYSDSTSSWTTAFRKSEEEKKRRKQQQEAEESGLGGDGAGSTTKDHHQQQKQRSSEKSEKTNHSSSSYEEFFKKNHDKETKQQQETEKEFGEDEDWFEFRSNFFTNNAKNLTPRDLYRLRFAQATTVKEIDDIYHHAMNENIYNGFDIGEPLHLALERYHIDSQLGLGEKHLEKCFATIEDWERRTRSTANCIYYQCILKLYTNEQMLSLYPDVDASIVSEVVWRVLQKMQDKEVTDDTGIAWWSLLNTALMFRDK